MKRLHRLQPRQKKQVQQLEWTTTELPLWANVGVYARQSTQMQVRTAINSTEMQTDDLVEFARRLGWQDEQIIVFTQDLGRSGRLRIDEREGLRTLVAHIEAGTMKAVIVFLEDRLFRDETQIQVNTFISICKQYNVLVITPSMTYNFHNRYHVKEFRWKCEAAADYLTDYVMARLVGAKQKVSERGEYDGRAIPVGFILDRDEWIELNGVKTKNVGYKRFKVYEPHAERVRWLYQRYLLLGGNLSRLCREIMAMPVLFPDFTPDVDRRSVSRMELKRVEGGYHVTRRGLVSILTNVSYLGWWVYQGEVKIKGNHPAIVDEDLFWYAFNRLSAYTLEGEENKQVKKLGSRYHKRADAHALLKNIISTELLGSVYVIPGGVSPNKKWLYALHEKNVDLLVLYHSSILVTDLDKIFTGKLLQHLQQTSDFEHYRNFATQERKNAENERISVQAQIKEIDLQCEGLMLSLRKPSIQGKLRDDLEKAYEALQQQRIVLVSKLEAPLKSSNTRVLLEYHELIDKLAPHWDELPFDDRKMLVEALTESVLLDTLAPHWMRLIIRWRDPQWGRDEGYIWRRYGSSSAWSEEENEILKQGYTTADRATLLSQLPSRSWHAIKFQANMLKLRRSTRSVNNTTMPEYVSYADWQFMQKQGFVYDKSWGLHEIFWIAEK